MSEAAKLHSGRIGMLVRGFLDGMVGIFLIQAALRYDLEQAGGLGDALLALAAQPYGPWALTAAGLGLMAYGFYTIMLARHGEYKI